MRGKRTAPLRKLEIPLDREKDFGQHNEVPERRQRVIEGADLEHLHQLATKQAELMRFRAQVDNDGLALSPKIVAHHEEDGGFSRPLPAGDNLDLTADRAQELRGFDEVLFQRTKLILRGNCT